MQVVRLQPKCLEAPELAIDSAEELDTAPQVLWGGPAEGCFGPWETCLNPEDADKLADWIERMLKWRRLVKVSCATEETEDAENP